MKTLALVLSVCCAECVLGGCYHHVVSARGAPPGKYQVYEPNLPDDQAGASASGKTVPTETIPTNVAPSR
jgi:hypothetical protein